EYHKPRNGCAPRNPGVTMNQQWLVLNLPRKLERRLHVISGGPEMAFDFVRAFNIVEKEMCEPPRMWKFRTLNHDPVADRQHAPMSLIRAVQEQCLLLAHDQ